MSQRSSESNNLAANNQPQVAGIIDETALVESPALIETSRRLERLSDVGNASCGAPSTRVQPLGSRRGVGLGGI